MSSDASIPTEAALKGKLCVFSHDGIHWSEASLCRDFEPNYMYTSTLMGEAYISAAAVDSGAGPTRHHGYARPAFILTAGTHELKWRILNNARSVAHMCTNMDSFDSTAPVWFKPLCRSVPDTEMSESDRLTTRRRFMHCQDCEARAKALKLVSF